MTRLIGALGVMFVSAAILSPFLPRAAAQSRLQKVAIIVETPGVGSLQAVKRILGTIPVMVVRPSETNLQGSLLALEEAAISGSEHRVSSAGEALGRVLARGGFDARRVAGYEEILVISRYTIPIDLLNSGGEALGRQTVISHLTASDPKQLSALLPRALSHMRSRLSRMAVLAVTALPSGFNRENHDIVKAALRLSHSVPVEIVVEPDAATSLRYLARRDIQILHIDTHGDKQGLQLGSRDPTLFRVGQKVRRVGARFVLLVGCSTGSGEESVAMGLVDRGAAAVVGMAFAFRSGEPSGGDITDARFYDTLWDGLARGLPAGSSLLRAKQALPASPWASMWLLFGNPGLNFTISGDK